MTRGERVLEGTGVTPLSAVGTVVVYDPAVSDSLPDPSESDRDPEREHERFRQARDSAREELQAERDTAADRIGKDEAGIFDAHIQFLDDPSIESDIEAAIDEGLPAEHGVDRAFENAIEQLDAAGGRMAERTDDLREVRDRLLGQLLGASAEDLPGLPDGAVVVAERLGPTDTAQLDPGRVAGFATATGGETSHAAIIARSLGIPAVVGLDELDAVEDGQRVAIDGEAGTLVVEPSEDRLEGAADGRDVEVRHGPVETTDGHEIEVAANVGSPAEASAARDRGADGVGLFRTEFFFLDRNEPPSEAEQYGAFVDVLETFEGDRVVVRTLDVGGDKPVPYLDVAAGENPFLGVRGVRLTPGERGDLFEAQLRALLRAAATDAGEGLAVLFPLVTSVPEVTGLLDRVDAVAETLGAEGVPARIPELGVMIETPASAFVAGELAGHVDFLSIGTNDLTQYVMAAARGDDRVASFHDPLHPPVLRAIDRTIRGSRGRDVRVGMCGEMAGDPALTTLLIGLGLDELSMSSLTVPDVKAAVTATDAERAGDLADRVLDAASRAEVESILSAWPDG
ncbi:phosphoenolpyruvate--protein phosphotransferase [Halobacteriales archaeon QH_10_65_19]|nr:MAG: phosphoenolpyruvate--protein phosphotransferase [Halobacteriales archaeon QH_10_65_19]